MIRRPAGGRAAAGGTGLRTRTIIAATFLGSTQIRNGQFNIWGTVLAVYVLAIGVKGLRLATRTKERRTG
jgi:ribose/xylose/arabinose/galactoside ABC-type transport system permease subunit